MKSSRWIACATVAMAWALPLRANAYVLWSEPAAASAAKAFASAVGESSGQWDPDKGKIPTVKDTVVTIFGTYDLDDQFAGGHPIDIGKALMALAPKAKNLTTVELVSVLTPEPHGGEHIDRGLIRFGKTLKQQSLPRLASGNGELKVTIKTSTWSEGGGETRRDQLFVDKKNFCVMIWDKVKPTGQPAPVADAPPCPKDVSKDITIVKRTRSPTANLRALFVDVSTVK